MTTGECVEVHALSPGGLYFADFQSSVARSHSQVNPEFTWSTTGPINDLSFPYFHQSTQPKCVGARPRIERPNLPLNVLSRPRPINTPVVLVDLSRVRRV